MKKPLISATLLLVVPGLALWPRTPLIHGLPPLYVPIKAAQAQEAPSGQAGLAQKAYAILETNCSSCHGNGKRLSKAATIDKDSWNKLVNEQKKVIPGKPDESSVYTLMIDHENPMPPKRIAKRPTPEEIEVVKQWIVAGAPDWNVASSPVQTLPVPQTPPVVVPPVALPTPVAAPAPTAVKAATAKPAMKPAMHKSSKPAARRPMKAKKSKKTSKKPLTKSAAKKSTR